MTNTILLADDSVTIQKVIELTFMDEDYEVVAVGNGDEALDRLEEVTPDVVIADVHMPGASGYDVARRAKQLHPQAPVLLLVGTFEPFDEADYQASGADAYLKKPFDSQELLHRVSELMAERAGLAEPAAAPAAESIPAGPLADAAAPPITAAAPAGGPETRFVPVWDRDAASSDAAPSAPDLGAWRPADEAAEDRPDPLGTQRMPTFGGEPAAGATPGAGESESEWSSWGLASEPEEVPSPAPPEEAEPQWAAGEAFEPAWEDAEAREPEEEAETPSWALDETDERSGAFEPSATAAAAAASGLAADWAVPSQPLVAPARHSAEPFPELSRAQPAAEASPVPGVGLPQPPAEAPSGDGRQAGLSEADVDRVARRVAELLGDRVIREVAWEVVPDLAEVVIKDRLRELESQVD